MNTALPWLALLPLAGASLPALARDRRRLAGASAALVLGLTLALDAWLLLTLPAGAAGVWSLPWVAALDLTLALRFDRLGGATALLVTFGGLVTLGCAHRRRDAEAAPGAPSALVVLFTGLAQAVALADNALLLVALALLAALGAFALEADRADATGGAGVALGARVAGALALLAAYLLIADATGSFEFGAILPLAASIRAEPLEPLLVALLYAGAWSRAGAWPWIRWPRPRAAPLGAVAAASGAVLLVTGAYLVARLWPLLAGTLPHAVVAVGFVATPLVVATLARAARAFATGAGADAPRAAGAGGEAGE